MGKEGIDFVTCRLCQRRFKRINHTHLRKSHGMAVREYQESFPGSFTDVKGLTNQSEEARRKNSASHDSEEWRQRVLLLWQDPEYREKQIVSHTGKCGSNASNWQGGIGNLPYPLEFNAEFKERVRERYDYTCVVCKRKQEQLRRKLDVHHIDYDKNNLDPDNFVPLCEPCHGVTKGKKNRTYWTKVLQNVVQKNKSFVGIFV